ITENVKKQLAERKSFTTMTGATYYGNKPDAVEFSDRKGGTFAEAETIGRAVAGEIIYVASGIETVVPQMAPWSARVMVNHLEDGDELIEIQALGIGDFAVVAEPGEVFVETALDFKQKLRRIGFKFPWMISYANDWQSYLATEEAFSEGGYEAERARTQKHTPDLQGRLWAGIREKIQEQVGAPGEDE
ncbi:MAG: hypothetical protein P8X90_36720, partial [Desulfobacterales bacterium]